MAARKWPIISLQVNKSVQFSVVTLAGVSMGYMLWKWLDGGEDDQPKKTRKKKTVPGLMNVGSSCFMNVLLQAFASCPSFVSWLEDFVKNVDQDKDHAYLAQVVLKILKVLTGEEEVADYYFDPSELLQDMSGRGWQISSQEQDSHEFYHAVMTTLLEEYRHHVDKNSQTLALFEVKELLSNPRWSLHPHQKPKETKIWGSQHHPKLRNPSFRGTLANVLQCQTCGYKRPIRYDGFDSLSLPLPSNLSWMAQISLVDCLRSFTAAELVNNVECVNCAKQLFSDENPDLSRRDGRRGSQSKVSDAISHAVEELSNIPKTLVSATEASSHCETDSTSSRNGDLIKGRDIETLMGGLTGITNCESVSGEDTAKDGVCSQKSNSSDISSENEVPVEEIAIEGSGAAELKTGCDKDELQVICDVTKLDKARSKPPFPKLLLTTQSHSFERCFQRRRYLGGKSEREFVFPSVRRTFQRRFCIGKLPDCLCMHLQRLVWIQGTPIKKMNFIRFPEILDVGPFTEISRIKGRTASNHSFSESMKNLTPSQMQKTFIIREATSNCDGGMEAGLSNTPPISLQGGSEATNSIRKVDLSSSNQALYRLTSVIVHVGDWSFSGHFLAYRRAPDSVIHGDKSEWIFTSDTMVRKATKEEVFSCPAYMLFYERIRP